jgi:YVTN family beta-propeller protein
MIIGLLCLSAFSMISPQAEAASEEHGVYVANNQSNSVSVIDTSTNLVVYSIQVDNGPYGVAVHPTGQWVYVSHPALDTVSVIATTTSSVVARVSVGDLPLGLAVAPDGSRVYVTNFQSKSISVVNTLSNTVVKTISIGEFCPWRVAFTPDGSRAFVTGNSPLGYAVVNTNTQSVDFIQTYQGWGMGLAVRHDGRSVYMAGSSGGQTGYIGLFDPQTYALTERIFVSDSGEGLALSTDDAELYHAQFNSGKLLVLDTNTKRAITTVTVGDNPFELAVLSTNEKLFVTNCADGTVSAIDIATHSVVATIRVGDYPLGIGIAQVRPGPPVPPTSELPRTIRVLRTATGEIEEVGFEDYVRNVLPNEWAACWDWDIEALRAGAMAVKTYGWYWTLHHKYPGQGYDVRDDASDQVYDPSWREKFILATPEGRYYSAVADSWSWTMKRNGEVFESQYIDGWPGKPEPISYSYWKKYGIIKEYPGRMSQWGTQYWAERGKNWQWILHYYYESVDITSILRLIIRAYCPVDIVVTDPDGLTVRKQSSEIPRASYSEIDLNDDGKLDDQVVIPERKLGDYTLTLIPEPDASSTDTFALEVWINDTATVFADGVQIADIPTQPYVIRSTEAEVVPIIPVTVDIDPNNLNLRSKGKWITAYIQLPGRYNPADINASTVLLNGTFAPILDPKYGFAANSSEYLVDRNGDSIFERMLKFDRVSMIFWVYESVGMRYEVSLTITGQLADGTSFRGTATILAFWQGHRSPTKR